MKKIIPYIITVLFSLNCFAQNQNNIWNFGFNCNINFNTNPPSSATGNQMQTNEGSAAVADKVTGALLFYTDGITVWTSNNTVMPNGNGLLGGNTAATNPSNPFSSTSAAVIVPRPFTPNIYYIFTIDQEDSSNGLRYSVVDMTLNGGLGDIVAGQKNIALFSTTSEKLQVVPNASGCGYWLLTHNNPGNTFIAFSITQTGIEATPVLSSVGSFQTNGRAHMKVSQQLNKIAMGNSAFSNRIIELFDFNNSTGAVSNAISWNYPYPFSGTDFAGVEFSPDGSKLYISNFLRIVQYDISLGTAALIGSSGFEVSTLFPSLTLPGTMQLGPDQKIYITSNPFSVINEPNNAAALSSLQLNPISGFVGTPKFGLPQKIYTLQQNIPNNSIIVSGTCQGTPTQFSLLDSSNVVGVQWNFDDPSTGVDNVSALVAPTHIFSNDGIYTVTATIQYQCSSITLTTDVTIVNTTSPAFNPIPDICVGTIPPILPLSSLNGITGTWSPATIDNTANGTYTFTPNPGQCATTATINTTVTPNTTPTFNPIPNICAGTTPPVLPTTSINGIIGTWSPAIIDNTVNGSYSFTPNPGQCATTTTINTNIINCSNNNEIVITGNCTNQITSFTLQDLTNIVSVNWNFGEPSAGVNNFATGLNAFYIYVNPGIYTVTAQVVTTTATYTLTQTINILPSIALEFSFPTFYLTGATVPTLPAISDNGIQGTWSPSVIDNTTSGSYTFTPTSNGCFVDNQVFIIIQDFITPSFTPITVVCNGSNPPLLPTTSLNGITGNWSPSIINNTTSGEYTFTPNPGQSAQAITIFITVVSSPPSITLTSPVETTNQSICINNFITPIVYQLGGSANNASIANLPSGIFGSISGTTLTISGIALTASTIPFNFTITTTGGNCGSATISGSITVSNAIIPTFNINTLICVGQTPSNLPSVSTNGITGTWSPTIISNTANGTYTFTPNPGQCATTTTINTTIIDCSNTNAIVITGNCTNQITSFTLLDLTNIVSVNWNFGEPSAGVNNFATGLNAPYIYANPGTYTVTAQVVTTTATYTLTQTITILPSVAVEFSFPIFYLTGSTVPALPTISDNGIQGTWSPSVIDNTTSGSYTFTPIASGCYIDNVVFIFVEDFITPTFSPITVVCAGITPPTLPTTSLNGIIGSWSPSVIDNTTSGEYTFTPNPGQSAQPVIIFITVVNDPPSITLTSPVETTNQSICINEFITPITYQLGGPANNASIVNLPSGIFGSVSGNILTISGIALEASAIPFNFTITTSGGNCGVATISGTITLANEIPTFNINPAICQAETPPVLPSISSNGITGTWSPATISNSASGTYTFTPNAGQCATTTTLNTTLTTVAIPTFSAIPAFCSGTTAPTLPTTSLNGITGTWIPTIIDNSISGTYTFTPNIGQCATTNTINIVVTPTVAPTFNSVPAFCAGTTPPILPTTSLNGVTGTWLPTSIDNTSSATYTFTPNDGQCATIASLNITVTPSITPTFNPIPAFCMGSTAPTLPTTSQNGITGTWSPAVISNTNSATYTFTPSTGQCTNTATLTTVVIQSITPTFNTIPAFCVGTASPTLPTTSVNGIIGTWTPPIVNNTTSGTYTFTPNSGQCATTATLTTTVTATTAPTFNAIPTVCSGTNPPILPTTSLNGIAGTWSPSVISNITSGNYTFTPNSGQCATTASLNVTVVPTNTPTFNAILPFCAGTVAPTLPSISLNGITGTWSPATIDNTTSGTYTFTPNQTGCFSTVLVSVTVNELTSPDFQDSIVCENDTSFTLSNVSPNGITGTWFPETVNLTAGGSYTFTPNSSECATNQTINISIAPSVLPTFEWEVNEPFADNSTITITPAAPGSFLYQLDFGPKQSSNVFTNVSSGLHTITVYDENGCAQPLTINDILVIKYPKFFTPNNDGYNDTWNINDLFFDKNSFIYIFDRYGKLLIQIFPNGNGWNGKFNNNDMPSTDYWFTVNYEYEGTKREFKSHFSLKR